jgi:uncharacterized membrane protein
MVADGPLARARENLTGIVSMLVTGIWLAALLTDQGWWLGFMLFGYIVLVPLTALLFGDEEEVREHWGDEDGVVSAPEPDRETTADEDDALATLRERYARGELTDEQFERKVEQLLETETLESAEDRNRTRTADRDARNADTESEVN